MDTFIRLLLECTLAMSAVIAATLALLPALRRLCSARSISLVFLILIAGLLVPWRLFPVEPALTLTLPAAAPAAQTVSRPGISPAATAATSLDAVSGTQTGPGLQSASSAQPSAVLQSAPTGVQSAPAVSRPRLRAQEVLALVWFAGFAAVLGGGIVSHVRFSRMARRWAQPICDPCRAASAAGSAAQNGDKRPHPALALPVGKNADAHRHPPSHHPTAGFQTGRAGAFPCALP